MGVYQIDLRHTVFFDPDTPNVGAPLTLRMPGTAQGVQEGHAISLVNRKLVFTDVTIEANDTRTIRSPTKVSAPAASMVIGQPGWCIRWMLFNNIWEPTAVSWGLPVNLNDPVVSDITLDATWTQLGSITVPGYGYWWLGVDYEVDWLAPGGNPNVDIELRILVNGTPVGDPWHYFDANKPTSFTIMVTNSSWSANLLKDDIITVEGRSTGDGTATVTANSEIRIFGPILSG